MPCLPAGRPQGDPPFDARTAIDRLNARQAIRRHAMKLNGGTACGVPPDAGVARPTRLYYVVY
jgi:hypothetical protein